MSLSEPVEVATRRERISLTCEYAGADLLLASRSGHLISYFYKLITHVHCESIELLRIAEGNYTDAMAIDFSDLRLDQLSISAPSGETFLR